MSIINEALKKAKRNRDGVSVSIPQEKLRGAIELEFQKRQEKINWGPVFVILVLVLITGPVVAPIFSTPFRRAQLSESFSSPVGIRLPATAGGRLGGGRPMEEYAETAWTSEAPQTRQPQFAVEEAPLKIETMVAKQQAPNFLLSGIVFSPRDSYCILNGKILKIGETLQGARLRKVTPDEVTLDFQGRQIILPVAS